MERRLDFGAVARDGFRATLAFSQYATETVDPMLFEMIKVRASMVNGCANCVDMHATAWMDAGEDVRRIISLSAWRESPYFTDRERAVLDLTDAVTRLGEEGVTDEVYDAVRVHFDEAEFANLVVAIATINVWNRIAIATRIVAAPLDAAPLDVPVPVHA